MNDEKLQEKVSCKAIRMQLGVTKTIKQIKEELKERKKRVERYAAMIAAGKKIFE